MRAFRYTAVALSVLAISGCSSDPSTALGESTRGTNDASLTVSVPEGGALDLRFEPQSLRAGERVTVHVKGLRLQSEAVAGGHAVRLDAPGRMVRRVSGLTDGEAQAVLDLDAPGGADGGLTARIPTSAHTSRVCQGSTCTEVVEYDYDLHSPTGEGTTAWRTPDGRSATIDRLRFELAAETAASAEAHRASQNRMPVLTITAPEALTVVR